MQAYFLISSSRLIRVSVCRTEANEHAVNNAWIFREHIYIVNPGFPERS